MPGRRIWRAANCRAALSAWMARYNHPEGNVNQSRQGFFAPPGWRGREAPHGPDGTPWAGQAPIPGARAREGEPNTVLRCAACRHAVTHAAWRIAVAGSHRNVFANPYGMVFAVGCFAAAPGCALMGQPSDAFTWFVGTRWQVAVCGACGAHLGWRYERTAGGTFFGLLLDRLVAGPSAGGGTDR